MVIIWRKGISESDKRDAFDFLNHNSHWCALLRSSSSGDVIIPFLLHGIDKPVVDEPNYWCAPIFEISKCLSSCSSDAKGFIFSFVRSASCLKWFFLFCPELRFPAQYFLSIVTCIPLSVGYSHSHACISLRAMICWLSNSSKDLIRHLSTLQTIIKPNQM